MFPDNWVIESSVLFRVILSVFLGGLLGLEREMHGRPAGLRTHVMVCLGAATLILASEFTQETLNTSSAVFNPDRVAAGIITGIGFLGAGAIMKEQNMVRGLTTAGSIWFVAGLGIVVGKKFYTLALCSTLTALVVLVLFRYLEHWVPVLDYRELVIRVGSSSYGRFTDQCRGIFEENGLEVQERKMIIDHTHNEIEIKFTVKEKRGNEREAMVMEVSRIPGVRKVIW
ncbi:MAG: MgtC/SapB family protein [Nitrospinaceae bacterium]